MADDKAKAGTGGGAGKGAAPGETPARESDSKVVEVKNICKKLINTSKSSIKPGQTGEATLGELRRWHKFIKRVKAK